MDKFRFSCVLIIITGLKDQCTRQIISNDNDCPIYVFKKSAFTCINSNSSICGDSDQNNIFAKN